MSDDTQRENPEINVVASWQNSDCPDLNELTSAMLRAREGTASEVQAAFMANAIAWLIGLENRVRALEGREAIQIYPS
jgi:hypothetical protein